MRHCHRRGSGGDVVVGLLSRVAQDHFLFPHEFLVGAKVVGVDDRRLDSESVGQRPELEKHAHEGQRAANGLFIDLSFRRRVVTRHYSPMNFNNATSNSKYHSINTILQIHLLTWHKSIYMNIYI